MNRIEKMKVIISGGGTGGHIFPAISIANAIKNRYPEAEFLFVGAEGRMEMRKVPEAGYKIVGLPVAGFDRKKLYRNFSVLYKLQKSLFLARKTIKSFKPDIAIGVGGYASGPLLKVAASKGIPTLIQEQNSYPGVTNKLLAKRAKKICVAYDGMERFFDKSKIVLTGNPCRQSLFSGVSREEACNFFELDPKKKTILVIGGSLGSKTINTSFAQNKEQIPEDVQVLWQSGEFYYPELYLELSHTENHTSFKLFDFIQRMDMAYALADLVVSRAGASSISELSLLKKPAILIPSPNVAEDHQTKNAMALVDQNAAILVKDDEAIDNLVQIAVDTVKDEEKLTTLSNNIQKFAHEDAANKIVNEIIKIVAKEVGLSE